MTFCTEQTRVKRAQHTTTKQCRHCMFVHSCVCILYGFYMCCRRTYTYEARWLDESHDKKINKYMICVRLKSAKIHCSNGILCGKLWFSVHHSINISANASETFMIGKQEAFIYHTRPTEDKPIAASNKCRTAISDCILEFNQNKSPLSRFQW